MSNLEEILVTHLEIIKILANDKNFSKNWKLFCKAAKLKHSFVYDIEMSMNCHAGIVRITEDLLEIWKSSAGEEANIKTLCELLRKSECKSCAEQIDEFYKREVEKSLSTQEKNEDSSITNCIHPHCFHRNKRKRSRTVDKQRRQWTHAEVNLVLDYLKNVIASGKKIEKPNAKRFYEKMGQQLNLVNCNAKSILNKVRALKATYNTTITWRNQSVRGVTDKNEIRRKTAILQRCKHFNALDGIFGSKEQINPICKRKTVNITGSDAEKNSDVPVAIQNTGTTNNTIMVNCVAMADSPSFDKMHLRHAHKKVKIGPPEFAVAIKKRKKVKFSDIKLKEGSVTLEREKMEFVKELKSRKVEIKERKCSALEVSLRESINFRKQQLAFEKEKFFKEKEIEMKKFKIEQETKMKIEFARIQNGLL